MSGGVLGGKRKLINFFATLHGEASGGGGGKKF